jgi:hypothetical protein
MAWNGCWRADEIPQSRRLDRAGRSYGRLSPVEALAALKSGLSTLQVASESKKSCERQSRLLRGKLSQYRSWQ